VSSAEALRDVLRFLNAHEFSRVDEEPLHIESGAIVAGYASLLLGSSFQTIVGKDEGVVGYKALVAARSSARRNYCTLDIPELIPFENEKNEVIYRDRLTRTMHALNYLALDLQGELHMSVNPLHLQAVHHNHGAVFEKILAQCGLQPNRIVLEIPEYAVADKHHLRTAIASWQQRHYRIAIDRFGAEHAQLIRVLNLRPDIIKFDSGFVGRLSANPASKEKLELMIEQIRANGIQAIATGIDDDVLYNAAREYSFSALQGQWLADHASAMLIPEDNVWGARLNRT
jgi:EAL domain-containing protein (putative c-di-GMP-specific phosphodiesterase class I)